MNTITRGIRVVRLPNGKYLDKWQYSQGEESHTEVEFPWEAHNFAVPHPLNIDFALKLYPGAVKVDFDLTATETP